MASTSTISVSTPEKPVKTILSVKVFVAPEKQAEFWQHYKPVFDKVVAEPECRYFVAGTDIMDPTCLCWTEGWSEDGAWLQTVQLKKEYYAPYLAATESMFLKEREIQLSSPQESMAVFKKPELE